MSVRTPAPDISDVTNAGLASAPNSRTDRQCPLRLGWSLPPPLATGRTAPGTAVHVTRGGWGVMR